MKRRDLIKTMGLFGSAALIPSMLGGRGFIANANATNVSQRKLINARAILLGEIDYIKPTVMPQIINIFLYGGPSELGGNLTNIREINEGSPNKYGTNIVKSDGDFGTSVTTNHFWKRGDNNNQPSAGGEVMEEMIAKGRLTVLRTLNREFDDSRAHRPSIFSNLTGLTGAEDDRPGIATNLASVLSANGVISEEAIFPFVTFEGDSVVFNRADLLSVQNLKPISLDKNLKNPYFRRKNSALSEEQNEVIEALAQTVANGGKALYSKANDAFAKRREIEVFIDELDDKVRNNDLPFNPDFVATPENPNPDRLEYPDSNFGHRLNAAVNLAISNPDTAFISLGSGGLGGWDDHDSAEIEYPPKLDELMKALNIAAKHLEAVGKANVMINVYGDFGRNVHLNGSMGWDHGNNQNLFTVSANPNATTITTGRIEGYQLGKIIGRTENYYEGNRQYTRPLEDSYQAAPFAVASTIYKYFGIQNPEIMTDNISPIDFVTPVNEWVDPSTMV